MKIKNFKKGFILTPFLVTIFSIVVISVSVLTIYFYLNNQAKPQQGEISSDIKKLEIIPDDSNVTRQKNNIDENKTSDLCVPKPTPKDWVYYSNPTYGIEFNYDPQTRVVGPSDDAFVFLGMDTQNGSAQIRVERMDYPKGIGTANQIISDKGITATNFQNEKIGCNSFITIDSWASNNSRNVFYFLPIEETNSVFVFQLTYFLVQKQNFNLNKDSALIYLKKILSTVNLISNLKVYSNKYTNKQYGFSFSYPKGWYVSTNDDIITISNKAKPNQSENPLIEIVNRDDILIEISIRPPNIYPADELKRISEWTRTPILSSQKLITVSGKSVLLDKNYVTAYDANSQPTKIVGMLEFLNNGVGYLVSYQPYDSNLESIFEDIMKTLIFK